MARNMYNPNGSLNVVWVYEQQQKLLEDQQFIQDLNDAFDDGYNQGYLDASQDQLDNDIYETAFKF